MVDIEKIIKGLECHKIDTNHRINCADCPYYVDGDNYIRCVNDLHADALELLKERVKTKVVFGRTKDGEFVTECGNCGTHLDKAYSNCPKCKKELDWNSCQS